MRSDNKFSLLQLAFLLGIAILFQSCDDNSTNGFSFNPPPPYDLSQADSSYTSDDGLQVYIIEEGDGPFEVIKRDRVSVKYTGRTQDGRVFDSTYRNGVETGILRNLTSVTITTSTGPVSPLIEGFRRALLGMVEGEKRTVIIPPSLGYADAREGTSGYSLRNDTLRFDIELVGIQ